MHQSSSSSKRSAGAVFAFAVGIVVGADNEDDEDEEDGALGKGRLVTATLESEIFTEPPIAVVPYATSVVPWDGVRLESSAVAELAMEDRCLESSAAAVKRAFRCPILLIPITSRSSSSNRGIKCKES